MCFVVVVVVVVVVGSLEVKLPTIWTDGKAEVGRVREEKKKN
jgi:Sec-independent protein translocase protein TatA